MATKESTTALILFVLFILGLLFIGCPNPKDIQTHNVKVISKNESIWYDSNQFAHTDYQVKCEINKVSRTFNADHKTFERLRPGWYRMEIQSLKSSILHPWIKKATKIEPPKD